MKEIERKFLLEKIPNSIKILQKKEIIQIYICSEEKTAIRVRKYGDNYFLTIKSGSGTERFEKEFEINKKDFSEIQKINSHRKIRKYRYICKHNNFIIEIDEFKDNLNGLLLAEVEFKNLIEAKNFSPPKWFGKDVTYNKKYTNYFLSKSQKIPNI